MNKLTAFLSSVLATISFVGFASVASAQSGFSAEDIASAPACQRFPGQGDYLCECAAGFSRGSVWGSGPYTADSNLCTAAVHAGAIGVNGGVIHVMPQPGQASYAGSVSNGVTTSNWGSYDLSVVIAAATPSTFLEACNTMPSDRDSYTCSCPANSGQQGGLWGSGPYTSDSNICAAARHAGYLDDGAGTVTVLRIQGLDSYAGSVWNNITSSSWGSYGSSIVFNGN